MIDERVPGRSLHRKRRAILICLRAAVRGSKAARRAIARGASVTTTRCGGGRGAYRTLHYASAMVRTLRIRRVRACTSIRGGSA